VTVFASHSREQLRQAYTEAWRKHLAHAPLTPLEALIADVIELHPEYRPIVEDLGKALAFEPNAVRAEENPFLHMGLHLAVREQMSIDRPPGVRELLRLLQARFGDLHGAEHVLMEALVQALWEAQRAGRAPDEGHYLALARARLSATPKT